MATLAKSALSYSNVILWIEDYPPSVDCGLRIILHLLLGTKQTVQVQCLMLWNEMEEYISSKKKKSLYKELLKEKTILQSNRS